MQRARRFSLAITSTAFDSTIEQRVKRELQGGPEKGFQSETFSRPNPEIYGILLLRVCVFTSIGRDNQSDLDKARERKKEITIPRSQLLDYTLYPDSFGRLAPARK